MFISNENKVFVDYNLSINQLFTETENENEFESFNICSFKNIAIDHVVPMKDLLKMYSEHLTGLNKLTSILKDNRVLKYNKNTKKKFKLISNNIIDNNLLDENDLKAIIDDLKFLDSKTELQLMCSTENLKKKKR